MDCVPSGTNRVRTEKETKCREVTYCTGSAVKSRDKSVEEMLPCLLEGLTSMLTVESQIGLAWQRECCRTTSDTYFQSISPQGKMLLVELSAV